MPEINLLAQKVNDLLVDAVATGFAALAVDGNCNPCLNKTSMEHTIWVLATLW
jgi:hypothetical protein